MVMNELEQQLQELEQKVKDYTNTAKKAKKSKLTYKITKTFLISLLANIPLALILHIIVPQTIIAQIISIIASLGVGAIPSYKTENEFKGMSQQKRLKKELEASIELEKADKKFQVIERLLESNTNVTIKNEDCTNLDDLTTQFFLANQYKKHVKPHEQAAHAFAEYMAFSMFSAVTYILPLLIIHVLPSIVLPAAFIITLLGRYIYAEQKGKLYQNTIRSIYDYETIEEIGKNDHKMSDVKQAIEEEIKRTSIKIQTTMPRPKQAPTKFTEIHAIITSRKLETIIAKARRKII